jgi:hypothetical protein
MVQLKLLPKKRQEEEGIRVSQEERKEAEQEKLYMIRKKVLQNRRVEVVVNGCAACAAACHAGGPGLIPGPGRT